MDINKVYKGTSIISFKDNKKVYLAKERKTKRQRVVISIKICSEKLKKTIKLLR